MSSKIKITNSGQTTTINKSNTTDSPTDVLHTITNVYFAKKVVTQNGTNVSFTRIDSAHTQNDAQNQVIPYDTILGKTVYLIFETTNMSTLEVEASLRPSNNNLTGNTDSISVMKFDPTVAFGGVQYTAQTALVATVGNFDALNNRDGSHTHFTNLADHSNKAIIKLQLRPAIRATFNTWSTNINASEPKVANIELVVKRVGNLPCAFKSNPEETTENGIFLNDVTGGQFRIVNRNFFTIYHRNNSYNIFANRTVNDPATRKRIGKLTNSNSIQMVYFYIDEFDNEITVSTSNILSVLSRGSGTVFQHVPPNSISNSPAPVGGEATTNYYYANNSIATSGTNNANPVVRYNAGTNNINLIRMPDSLTININNVVISYVFYQSQRRFCNPQCFAGFIGVLAQFGRRITSTGMCFGDATSYPSVSHPNGDSIDSTYASTLALEQLKVNAFHEYGFAHILRGNTSWYGQLLNSTYHSKHESHLHSGDFNDNFIEIMYA